MCDHLAGDATRYCASFNIHERFVFSVVGVPTHHKTVLAF